MCYCGCLCICGKIWKIENNNKGFRQILKTNYEYNETGYQLFIDVKEAYDSVSSVQ